MPTAPILRKIIGKTRMGEERNVGRRARKKETTRKNLK
jgi:hypothetical protein